ncbi:MAG: hypothetical protein BWY65_01958 [Firmicutes bacterium ADurb.Bin373]|nr:MAG: hypothetical protein BWY65_01958 [Firmicutes bacterium ADurb.Bin373]
MGLLPPYLDTAAQAKIAEAVDNAEINRLGPAAHLRGYLRRADAKDLRRCPGMDIFPAHKGVY